MQDKTTQAAVWTAIAQDSGPYACLPVGVRVTPGSEAEGRPGVVRGAGAVATVLWAHRRQLHRIGWQAVGLLWTVRRAFPWALRVLVVIGAIQVPFLPTDEIAAVAALIWIVSRYRRLARVIWHAAVAEVTA